MGKYLEDKELNTVLENYFEEADEKEVIEKELTRDGLQSLDEGILSDVKKKQYDKDKEKMLSKFNEIMKNNKYKYYVIVATNYYMNYGTVYDSTKFVVYGSNVRAFSKSDRGAFRTWKKDMEAKKLGSFWSRFTEKINQVPSEIRKYIL